MSLGLVLVASRAEPGGGTTVTPAPTRYGPGGTDRAEGIAPLIAGSPMPIAATAQATATLDSKLRSRRFAPKPILQAINESALLVDVSGLSAGDLSRPPGSPA